MRQNGRGLLLLLGAVIAFLLIMPTGRPAAATDSHLPTFAGYAQIAGPLQLDMTIAPAVARPGDSLTLNLTLTNHTNAPAVPQLAISLPAGLSLDMRLLPTGTTYNVQSNALSWQPLLPAGGLSQLIVSLHVDVANIAQAEQTITATLRDGEHSESIAVAYWAGVPPQVTISASPQQVAVGQPVQLLAQATGSGPFSEQWELGDGRTVNVSNPIVAYSLPGTYQVTLRLANPLTVATATTWVTVLPHPTAQFTLNDLTPGINQPVTFISQSGGHPPLRYYWDFGDGAFSEEADPIHAYPAAGTYLVRLIVENEFGRSEITLPIVVGQPPIADMVLNPATAAVGAPVSGQAFGDQTVTIYQWDMGDGRTLTGEQISHVYQRPGDFFVTLSAGNDFGNTVISNWIHVDPGFLYLFLPFIYNNGSPGAPGGSTAGLLALEGVPTASTPIQVARFSLETNPEVERLSQIEQLFWYVNEARRLHDLPPLNYVYELSLAAQHHTGDMAAVPGVMHTGSDGSSPAGRFYRFGYRGGYAGEATAWGFAHAYEAVAFWVNSPPHRTIILGQAATDLGVGYTVSLTAPNIWYWTAEFGSSWLPPVQEEILPTPQSDAAVLTLLEPAAAAALPGSVPATFTWDWPRPLAADEQFVVYLVNSANGAVRIGSTATPVEGSRYALSLAADWTFLTGEYQWQVRLESRSAVAALAASELRPLTLLPRPTTTPMPLPTLPPATPAPLPTATATTIPLPTPLPISTDAATVTPTENPTIEPTATETAPPPPTDEPTPTSLPIATVEPSTPTPP